MSALPLADIKVLDTGGALTAYAGKLLSDLGADVVLVEPPGGDPLRRRPPLRDNGDDPQSLVFAYYHADQEAMRVDVSDAAASAALAELAADCDVILLSPTPDRPVVGLDTSDLTLDWASGSAVVLCLTPFGLTG
jgi:crotonobetainyl-CoA:carnitine CoA-transferase CaiB-like acyl-CoA transferase